MVATILNAGVGDGELVEPDPPGVGGVAVKELEVEELEGKGVEDKSDDAEPTLLPPPQPSKTQLDVTTSKDDMNC